MIAQRPQQDKEKRLEVLRQYDILDSPPEAAFDDLASLAANLCNTPISFITLVDKDRQWVKSQVGLHVCEVPREFSICANPIPHSDLFMVPDTSQDGRFADHPWVTGDPQIRFYAGAPLKTPEGHVLGTLCVLDRVPRVLNARQQEGLTTLSRQVLTQLDLRHHRKLSRLKVEVRGGKNQLDFMTNAIPLPVAYVDVTLQYRFTNQAYGAFLGIPTGTLEGRCIQDVLGQAAYETVKPYIDKVLSGHPVSFEQELPCSQDNTRYVEATLTPDFEGSHAVKGFWIVVKDLTNGRGMEERFRLAVEAAQCGMVMSNQEGKIVLVNSQTERLFGYAREELMNQPLEILVPEQYRHTHREYQDSVFADLQHRFMGMGTDFYGLHKNETTFPVEIQLNPIMTPDGVMVLNSILDITERKQAEVGLMERNQLLALDAEMGQIINKGQELGTLLQSFTEALVRHLKAAFARIWTLNATEQILELQASAGLYTHLNGTHGRVPVGQLKIGQIAAEKKPHLTNAVIGDPLVPEQEWAKREGLVAFAGYPLLKDQEVLGVMALFSKHPLTEFTLNSLGMMAVRITMAIERQMTTNANQRLAKHNERILASAGEGIFGLDLEGKTTFVNPAGARMLGYRVEDLLGMPMHSTMHHTRPDGSPYPQEACPIYAAFKDGIVHHVDDEVLWRKGGTSFPVDYTSTPIWEDGRLVGAVVTFQDITERKCAQEARETLQNAVNQAMEGFGLLDNEGVYTYVNPAHAAMYGYSPAEFLGLSWKALYGEDQIPHIEQEAFPLLKAQRHWQGELIGRKKNGDLFFVEVSLTKVQESMGKGRLICSCRDITQRKQAEEAINRLNQELEQRVIERTSQLETKIRESQEARERIQSLAKFPSENPNPVLRISREGRVLYANKASRSLLTTWRCEKGQSLPEPWHQMALEGFSTNLPQQGEVECSSRVFSLIFAPIEQSNYMNIYGLEVTTRKRAEEALREKTNQLEVITEAMTGYLESGNWREASWRLIQSALRQTESEYGFVGVVLDGPVLRILAYEGIVWDEKINRPFYEEAVRTFDAVGYLEFTNFKNLFGHAITSGAVVLSNSPASDPRAGGSLPKGHPPLKCFLGVPIFRGNEVVGIIGVANRQNGYTGIEQDMIQILTRAVSVLYENYRQREREATLEVARKEAEEQIRRALKEKEVLLKEIHHRVKNNLQVVSSLLSLQASRLVDDEQREPFQVSQDRLQAMILIHEQLYRLENLAEISFGEFIERQAHELFRAYGVDSDKVTLEIRAEGVRLDIDKAIPCGLIVTELLTNVLKYAFPGEKAGKITIQLLSGQDAMVTLKISDNGVGLPDSLDIRHSNSLGMRLVCALTDQLEGKIELEREGGTEFMIQFPR